MQLYWTKTRPDMHSSSLAWERSWQRDLDQNLHIMSTTTITIDSNPYASACLSGMPNTDDLLVALEQEASLLCKLQHDLAREASRRSAEEHFETRWKAATPNRRQEVILEGLVRTMSIPDMDERRKMCPESTLRDLSADGGEAFLRVLHDLMPADISVPLTEPVLLPHPIVDRVFTPGGARSQLPRHKTMLRSFQISRTYCLTTIIWNTFLAFYGVHEEQFAARSVRSSIPMQSDAFDMKMLREVLERAQQAQSEIRKGLVYACVACTRREADLPSGTKLQACSKCRAIGRRIYYCSRDCQAKDWTSGTPRPHKVICGRPLSDEEILDRRVPERITEEVTPWLPSADPSFRRSPALLHQLKKLKVGRGVVYVVIFPHNMADRGILVRDTMERFQILVYRNRAFRTGDPLSINILYTLLEPHLDRCNVPRPWFRKQLEAEFGLVVEGAQITEESLPSPEEVSFIIEGTDAEMEAYRKEKAMA